jgi:hypothetical protein
MPGVGFETWWPKRCPTVFKVMNITPKKMVRVFQYPIAPGMVRDLLDIPVVSEADIRHSLLKGELNMKILCNEIRVVESNIDLLQFDECQKAFLQAAGITDGLEVSGGGDVNYLFRQNIPLIGVKNSANKIFIVPAPDKFLNGLVDGNEFRIIIDHNGRRLIQNIDYIISESGGPGTGFDTIEMISFVPNKCSKLIADYVVDNPNV